MIGLFLEAYISFPRWKVGTRYKNTETFIIGTHEWRIWWWTSPEGEEESNFQIYVHKANGDLVDVAANVIGRSNEFTTMRGKGSYYLKIVTGQPYMITVYEDKK